MKPFPPLFYLNMCNAAAAKTKGAVYMNHSLIEQAQSGDGEALITLIDNAYTPIAIFSVIYVQYKLNKTA